MFIVIMDHSSCVRNR